MGRMSRDTLVVLRKLIVLIYIGGLSGRRRLLCMFSANCRLRCLLRICASEQACFALYAHMWGVRLKVLHVLQGLFSFQTISIYATSSLPYYIARCYVKSKELVSLSLDIRLPRSQIPANFFFHHVTTRTRPTSPNETCWRFNNVGRVMEVLRAWRNSTTYGSATRAPIVRPPRRDLRFRTSLHFV